MSMPTIRPSPKTDLTTLKISQPAHRALAAAGIKTLAQLAKRTEAELLALHGFGPKAITILKPVLKANGLAFKGSAPATKKTAPARATRKPSDPEPAQGGSKAADVRAIDAYLASLGDWRGTALAQIRKIVLAAVPGMVETWKWNVPVWARNGNVVAASAMKQYVKINFFKGASLSDPDGMFNAGLDSKVMRSIDIHPGDKLNAARLKALVKAAAALNNE